MERMLASRYSRLPVILMIVALLLVFLYVITGLYAATVGEKAPDVAGYGHTTNSHTQLTAVSQPGSSSTWSAVSGGRVDPVLGDSVKLSFDPDAIIEQSRNTVQTDAAGRPFIHHPAHQALFTDGRFHFMALAGDKDELVNGETGEPVALLAADRQLWTLNLELAQATVGQHPIPIATAQTYTVAGNIVSAERGTHLVEEFVARDEGVEQRWRLEKIPDTAGDLTLTVLAETPLTLAQAGADFVFQMADDGGVPVPIISYSRALAIDANGRTQWAQVDHKQIAAEPGANRYHISFTFSEAWLAAATYPILIDPLISNLVRLEQNGPASDQSVPEVAYNPDQDQFLLVWQDYRGGNWDIYAQRVNGDGALLGANFVIANAAHEQSGPRVAYGNGVYLVAWKHHTSSSSAAFDTYGAIISGTGSILINNLPIAADNSIYDRELPSDIVYNTASGEFLVLYRTMSGGWTNVWSRRVASDGTMQPRTQITSQPSNHEENAVAAYHPAANDYLAVWASHTGSVRKLYAQRLTSSGSPSGPVIDISSGSGDERQADIIYLAATERYVVTWRDDRNSAGSSYDVYAQRLAPDGSLDGSNFVVTAETVMESAPRLKPDAMSGGALVVWQQNNGGLAGYDLHGRYLGSDGLPAGNSFALETENGHQSRPVLAQNSGGDFLIAWYDNRHGDQDIFTGMRMADGRWVGAGRAHPAAGAQEKPQVAYNPDDDEYLVVWQDYRGGEDWDIYGQRVAADGSLIGQNLAIDTTIKYNQREPRVAYGANEYLVVWQNEEEKTGYLGVYGRVLNRNGSFATLKFPIQMFAYTRLMQESPTAVIHNSTANQFLVLWEAQVNATNWNILASHVLPNGTLGTSTTITNLTIHEVDATGAYNPDDDQYLVVWEEINNFGYHAVYGRRLTGSGTVITSDYIQISTNLASSAAADVMYQADTNQYIVVWQQLGDIYSRGVLPVGEVAPEGPFVVANSSDYETYPRLAPNATGAFVTWQAGNNFGAQNDLYGRLLDSDGRPDDDVVTVLEAEDEQQNAVVAYGGNDHYLLAWQDNREGAWDVYAALFTPFSPQLHVSKSGPTVVDIGDLITYTLTISNGGPLTATHLLITDTLPASAHYVSGGTLNGNEVSWSLPLLGVGQGTAVSFVVTATTTITNSDYGVIADDMPQATLGDEALVTLVRPLVDFTAAPLSGTWPLTVTFANLSVGGQSFLWDFGNGATATQANPTHTYTATGVYTVTLTAFGDGINATLTRPNYIVVTTPPPTLTISKTAPAIVDAGDHITYTLTVTNSGLGPAHHLHITDTLPTNASYRGGGRLINDIVHWFLPALPSGSAAQVQFVVTANETITNQVYSVLAHNAPEAKLSPTLPANDMGHSVVVSGTTAVVGAVNIPHSAYVFLFEWDGYQWAPQGQLLPGDGATGNWFGASLALSDDTLLVGAPGDDDLGSNAGAVYVYVRDTNGQWQYLEKLLADNGGSSDQFGISVALDGETAVIGAYKDSGGGYGWGSVYVFERDVNDLWQQDFQILPPLAEPYGWPYRDFGFSVAIDQDTIVIGAPDGPPSDNYIGHAFVFKRDAAGWVLEDELIPGGASRQGFGLDVAVDGDTVAVAANLTTLFSSNSYQTTGRAYVFRRSGNNWLPHQRLNRIGGSSNDGYGSSIAMAGDTILVGAPYDNDNSPDAGAAYRFQRDATNTWVQDLKLTATDGDTPSSYGYQFGWSVALNHENALVGARSPWPYGAAYMYDFAANTSVQATGQEPVVTLVRPSADFTAVPVTGTAPLMVNFTNLTLGGDTYLWRFGDGAASTATDPSHLYLQPGVYTVTLTAYNPVDADVITKTNYITVAVPRAWQQITPTNTISAWGSYALAFDSQRQVAVLYGGRNDWPYTSHTWEFNGTTWLTVTTSQQPEAVYGAAMVYDQARGHSLLFGGSNAADEALAQTWSYDGLNWSQQTPANAPPARTEHQMVYNPATQTVFLFGGRNQTTAFSDVWEYDGVNWTQITVGSASPQARSLPALAFNPADDTLLLFGGRSYNGAQLGDTWAFDPTTASWAFLPGGPAARQAASMVYDPTQQRLVLVGGVAGDGDTLFSDTWGFAAGMWVAINASPPAPAVAYHTLIYDSNDDALILLTVGQTWKME